MAFTGLDRNVMLAVSSKRLHRLLASVLLPRIGLSCGRMVWMALPYTITMSVTGLAAVCLLRWSGWNCDRSLGYVPAGRA